jgi:prolactin regulatory element-binding protein
MRALMTSPHKSFLYLQLVVATTVNLLVYSLKTTISEKGKETTPTVSSLSLAHTVERPTLPGNFAGSNFRTARFHPTDPRTLYTVVNTVPPRTRTKSSPRVAFVVKWDTEKWEVVKLRKIGEKGATCFDVRYGVQNICVLQFNTDRR